MTKVDWSAVSRRIDFAESQLADTRRWIEDAEAGRYSPLMSSSAFEEQFDRAVKATGADVKAICVVDIPRPHRCSRCEAFVQAFMSQKLVGVRRA